MTECSWESRLCSLNDTSFRPRAGSRTRLMLDAHCPQSQKCAVSRCGFSSNGAELSSLAASEIETTSNWKSLPSENEYSGRLQPSLTQRASIQIPTGRTLQGKSYLSNTVGTVFHECLVPDLFDATTCRKVRHVGSTSNLAKL